MFPTGSGASEYGEGIHTKRVAEVRAELPDPVKQALSSSRVVWPLVTSVATTIVMAYDRQASIPDNRTTSGKVTHNGK